MASGKKNYFRHSFYAFEDEKIQKAIDALGYEGYAYYFILLEILARKCELSPQNPITIHQQTLRNVWRKQTKSCKKVVEKLQESGLFVATFKESFVEFDIPNLSKYLGRYQIKFPPNVPNKKKEKEKKGNKKKVKEKNKNIYADQIKKLYEDFYPRKEGKTKGIEKLTSQVKSDKDLTDLETAIKNYADLQKEINAEKKHIKFFSSFASSWRDYVDIKPSLSLVDLDNINIGDYDF